MAQGPSFFFFLLFLCHTAMAAATGVTSSDIPLFHAKHSNVIWEKKQLFPSLRRVLIEYYSYRITQHDSIDPPTTPLPSPPITNPVTNPPINGIVTVPSTSPSVTNPVSPPVTNPVNPPVTNPVSLSITNPVSPSVTNPVSPPATNPVNPPVTNPVSPSVTNPVSPPFTNPISPSVTNPVSPPVNNPISPPSTNPVSPSVTNPVNSPVPATNPSTTPTGLGRWCIAKNGASQAVLQAALDYACGTGGADCATIQQGSSCYEPATLQNHASYAFNSYYQKNPAPTSCDFGGAAAVTTTNPSIGSCVYPSLVAAPLTTQAPVNPTPLPTAPPTTSSSFGPRTQYPLPPGFSIGSPNPTGAFGASPPLLNNPSASNNLRPFIEFLLTVAFFFM